MKAPDKSLARTSFLYRCLLAKVKHIRFKAPKLGNSIPLERSLNIFESGAKLPTPKHEFRREFKDDAKATAVFEWCSDCTL